MQIIKLKATQQKYRITDNEHNRKLYPKFINQIMTNPPSFARVELVKEEYKTFQDIYDQSLQNPNPIQKFIVLSLRENYKEKEIIQKISELYNKNIEESMSIFKEVILKLAHIKGEEENEVN
jgi:hypothetical protein